MIFASEAEYLETYKEIESNLAKSSVSDYDYFSRVQRELGISSLYVSEFDKGIRNIEEAYTKNEIIHNLETDYIIDDVKKVLLNEHYEIGIGSDVYVYYGPNLKLTIKNGNLATLEKFRRIEKGGTKIPFDIIDPNVTIDTDVVKLDHEIWPPVIEEEEEEEVDFRSDNYVLSISVKSINCDVFGKELSGSLQRLFTNDNGTPDDTSDDFGSQEPWDGNFTISAGDGSASYTFSNIDNYSFTHQYNATGDFNYDVVVSFVTADGDNATLSKSVDIPVGAACTDENVFVSQWVDEPGTPYAMSTKIWFTGGWAKCFTHAWRYSTSKAKWERKKAELNANVTAVFLDNVCDEDRIRAEEKYHGNTKKLKASVWGGSLFSKKRVGNGDIHSYHECDFGQGFEIVNTLVLNPC